MQEVCMRVCVQMCAHVWVGGKVCPNACVYLMCSPRRNSFFKALFFVQSLACLTELTPFYQIQQSTPILINPCVKHVTTGPPRFFKLKLVCFKKPHMHRLLFKQFSICNDWSWPQFCYELSSSTTGILPLLITEGNKLKEKPENFFVLRFMMSVSVLTVWQAVVVLTAGPDSRWPNICGSWYGLWSSACMLLMSCIWCRFPVRGTNVMSYCISLLLPCHCQNISGSQHPALPIVSDNKGPCVQGQTHKHIFKSTEQ